MSSAYSHVISLSLSGETRKKRTQTVIRWVLVKYYI